VKNISLVQIQEEDGHDVEWNHIDPVPQPKTYHVTAHILSNVDNCVSFIDSKIIPVYSGNKVIGCVESVYTEGKNVFAELILDYSSPERFDLQNDVCIWGIPSTTVEDLTLSENMHAIVCSINKIELVYFPNNDLQPLGNQF
jgi:hypothetical protein